MKLLNKIGLTKKCIKIKIILKIIYKKCWKIYQNYNKKIHKFTNLGCYFLQYIVLYYMYYNIKKWPKGGFL